jgi:drug/metabolite transporter (DMT)-like permease
MSLGLRYEKAGRAAAINYLIVVNAFLFDAFVFDENIRPTDVLGATCIILFTFLNVVLKCLGRSN